jgi:hypothetical protein
MNNSYKLVREYVSAQTSTEYEKTTSMHMQGIAVTRILTFPMVQPFESLSSPQIQYHTHYSNIKMRRI